MKLSQGVEWSLHCAALIAQAPDGAAVSRRVLAEHYGLPEAYLAKHLQALTRAGLLTATPGPGGGFRLARPADEVTTLDVLEAIEGSDAPFLCQEIRRRGTGAARPQDCTRPCAVTTVMARAHQAWRDSLRQTTLADLVDLIPANVRAAAASQRPGQDPEVQQQPKEARGWLRPTTTTTAARVAVP